MHASRHQHTPAADSQYQTRLVPPLLYQDQGGPGGDFGHVQYKRDSCTDAFGAGWMNSVSTQIKVILSVESISTWSSIKRLTGLDIGTICLALFGGNFLATSGKLGIND
ncbi:hypothetical protein KC356_g584 [Hortaea werneckii]|nr:hypothetical protein KC356_g584 [Hortaea werneckii]KAI7380678.1 hypothetical protein KC336_g18959 [Hortaea werneckii]